MTTTDDATGPHRWGTEHGGRPEVVLRRVVVGPLQTNCWVVHARVTGRRCWSTRATSPTWSSPPSPTST